MKTEMLTKKRPKAPTASRTHVRKSELAALKLKNVLVPLDFSPASHAAIQFALPLLTRFNPNLHLVHVLPLDSPYSGFADMPMIVPEIEIARRVRRDLSRAAASHGVKTRACDLHMLRGSPFEEICQFARQIDIDLIVMSTRGHTGLKHLALGSTAERVVRYAPCPVLVVRDGAEANKANGNGKTPRRPSTISRILVPIDFSDCSMKGLNYAKQLAREFGATLTVIHSIPVQYYLTNDEYARFDLPLLMQQSEKIAQKQMRDVIATTQRDGVKVEPSLQFGHAGDHICAHAEAEKADIIVISTHGRTGLKRVLLGSTAEYVVRHATCPVLVVPNHERHAIT
jgi:nucleotide-binding universal stress UspA family protein